MKRPGTPAAEVGGSATHSTARRGDRICVNELTHRRYWIPVDDVSFSATKIDTSCIDPATNALAGPHVDISIHQPTPPGPSLKSGHAMMFIRFIDKITRVLANQTKLALLFCLKVI